MPKKLKTMDIKRKNRAGNEVKVGEYVTVKERVKEFHNLYPKGSIYTKIVDMNDGTFIIQATVTPDSDFTRRSFTGYAQEKESNGWINKTDCLENCETSAVGRALGFLGIGIDQAIATSEDIKSAIEAYENIKPQKSVVSMPKEVKVESDTPVESTETALNDDISTEVSNIEQEDLITKEMAQDLIKVAKDNGYTQIEFHEIIGYLGYAKVDNVLKQDYDTILQGFSKPAEEYRKNQQELWNKEN